MVAAKQPQLSDAWLSLYSSLDQAVSLLSALQPNFPHSILHSLFKEATDVPYPPPTPWDLAASRGTHITKVPYQHSWSLRRVLLDRIHGFYLKALARMPGGKLRSRYRRSMLKAGHCYGPFDPVSNIIVNTIWYEASFPPLTRRGNFNIVGTWSLMRIEAQSFYGLLSLLCTCQHALSVHQAMRFLLDSDLNLTVTKLCGSVHEQHEAFRAAAIAAWHPNPDAQAGFLSSCKKPDVSSLLSDEGPQQLSSQVFKQLVTLLSSAMSTQQQQQPVSISRRQFNVTMAEGSKLRRAHTRVYEKVKDALRKYEKQDPEHNCYQLHVVCGVNESVSGPDNSEDFLKRRDNPCDDNYHHTHANFLATRNVGSVCSVPILFFAELSNDDNDDDDKLLCCPVDIPPPGAEPVRCLFCEREGIRIVHPGDYPEGFNGGHALEFEKMVRGEDLYDNGYYPEIYSNHHILRRSELVARWMECSLKEDFMYLGSKDFTIQEDNSDESEDFDDE